MKYIYRCVEKRRHAKRKCLYNKLHFFLQLTANALVFIAVNIVGIFVHNLMEHAQRRAFLDTRNCIAARIEMEEENEKLERLLLSVLVSELN